MLPLLKNTFGDIMTYFLKGLSVIINILGVLSIIYGFVYLIGLLIDLSDIGTIIFYVFIGLIIFFLIVLIGLISSDD